jgi:hypothetical protein
MGLRGTCLHVISAQSTLPAVAEHDVCHIRVKSIYRTQAWLYKRGIVFQISSTPHFSIKLIALILW